MDYQYGEKKGDFKYNIIITADQNKSNEWLFQSWNSFKNFACRKKKLIDEAKRFTAFHSVSINIDLKLHAMNYTFFLLEK